MDYIINGELYHHGVKGQKWGVHRNKKEYKSALKTRKRERRQFEKEAYASSQVANVYNHKHYKISKQYNKQKNKDPNELKTKTQYLKNTKNLLDKDKKYWNDVNNENVRNLNRHVESMINEFSNTKIKSVNNRTYANGVKHVDTLKDRILNSGTRYTLSPVLVPYANATRYTPVKVTTHY